MVKKYSLGILSFKTLFFLKQDNFLFNLLLSTNISISQDENISYKLVILLILTKS